MSERKTVSAAVAGDPAGGEPDAPPPVRRSRLPVLDPVETVERYGIVVVWAAVILVFSLARSETFPTVDNFRTIFGTQVVLLVLTLGLLIPLRAGEFDLSIGAAMGIGATMFAWLNVNQGAPTLVALAGALAVGVAVGMLNAGLVVWIGVPSLVATLGVGTLVTGLTFGISDSVTIGGVSEAFQDAVSHQVFGLPLAFYVGVALCVATWYVFEHTPLGRYLLFVGESRQVARLAGLRVSAIRAGSLVACSTLAVIAGLIQVGTVGAADPGGGASYLLPAFAGAFLGQTAIRPGRFNAWGAFIAVYFLVTGVTGLELLGQVGWVQDVFYGGSLVIAVAVARLGGRRRLAAAAAQ